MKRSTVVWTVLMSLAGLYLIIRVSSGGMGLAYVRAEPAKIAEDANVPPWTVYVTANAKDRNQPDVMLSWPRTIGIWVSALFTLCILSFLWGDNVFYKFAESIVVGASAGYAMVVGFWTGIVQNLFGKLTPELVRETVLPGLAESQQPDWVYVVPLVLSVLMLMRLSPAGGWISRWPLAFFIGATAGIRLVAFLDADFIKQIQATVIPLAAMASDGSVNWASSLKNTTIVVGVLSSLVYFFFSIEHKGFVGGVSRLGIWVLMITFGAGFGYTVMGRIALIAQRLEFLFDDWLWLIDPASKRLGL